MNSITFGMRLDMPLLAVLCIITRRGDNLGCPLCQGGCPFDLFDHFRRIWSVFGPREVVYMPAYNELVYGARLTP